MFFIERTPIDIPIRASSSPAGATPVAAMCGWPSCSATSRRQRGQLDTIVHANAASPSTRRRARTFACARYATAAYPFFLMMTRWLAFFLS